MMSRQMIFQLLKPRFSHVRNLSVSRVRFEQRIDDPIQKLFLEKLKVYKEKSAGGKKMFEPTPEIEIELKQELQRLNKKHGGDGKTDMSKFPPFEFPEIKLDPINAEDRSKKSKK